MWHFASGLNCAIIRQNTYADFGKGRVQGSKLEAVSKASMAPKGRKARCQIYDYI